MDIPKYEELNASNGRVCSIEIHYPKFYKYLIENFPKNLSFSEKLYWYYNNIKDKPTCKICGKKVKFINFRDGYRKYCSQRCMQSDPETLTKKKKTSLERYGVENAMQCDEKKQKLKQTNLKKYGVENPFMLQSVKEKIIKTNIKKYGKKHHNQTQEAKERLSRTMTERFIEGHPDWKLIDNESHLYRIPCPHADCNKCVEKWFETDAGHQYDRIRWNIETCTRLLPLKSSHNSGTTIELFVQNILDLHNISYDVNVRGIIGKKELDIYIPDKHIAIECNGDYVHQKWYNSSRHYDKYIESKNNNIQLIQIYDDQIELRPKTVESLILSKLGIYEKRIGARNCKVKLVDSKTSKKFMNMYHLQGNSPASIKLGLYFNDDLIALMTFGQKRRTIIGDKKKENNTFELIRFATKHNTQVIGGAGKLFSYFIKNYNPSKIISYSSNDISHGGLYQKLGFKFVSINKHSYWYVNNTKPHVRHHRSGFSLSELKRKGLYEPGKSETEIMNHQPYWKIYDSGTTRWEWVKN